MKNLILLAAASLACITPSIAADAPKPLVSVSAKRQVLDSDHDLRRRFGSSSEKIITLRVEIVNVSTSPITAGELSGVALIMRAGNSKEKIVSEALGKIPLPAMKPNEKITLDLGKIQLTETEWRDRKFEETLEEWKVTCTQDGTEIGGTVSSANFEKLEKDAEAPSKKDGKPGRKKNQKALR